ncbi:hypothetical protein PF004_g17622 [Phytophthora fragariae]|uniref:RxLR effector protein n=1 Tax=Phytophthora fragariae TaxID=53985 RepID=A0A6G0NEX4_9STRA|nr:hypothetical protein PF004_g17622 [Phytophthora fragariae]
MVRHDVFLLVFTALLANADASLAPPTASGIQRLVHSTIVSQGATSTTRLLRVHKSSSHDDDERVITAPSLETVANSIKSTVSVEKLHDWPKKGESADDVFKLLTLDKAADDFLAHPNVNAWINYIKLFNEENPTKRASLIATLTAQYGDDGLAKIIEAAKRVPSTEDIANTVLRVIISSGYSKIQSCSIYFRAKGGRLILQKHYDLIIYG